MIYFQNLFLFELTGAHNVIVIEIIWFVHKCNNLIIFMAFFLETFSVDEQYLDAVMKVWDSKEKKSCVQDNFETKLTTCITIFN